MWNERRMQKFGNQDWRGLWLLWQCVQWCMLHLNTWLPDYQSTLSEVMLLVQSQFLYTISWALPTIDNAVPWNSLLQRSQYDYWNKHFLTTSEFHSRGLMTSHMYIFGFLESHSDSILKLFLFLLLISINLYRFEGVVKRNI